MTYCLPPNLLALFAPREPIPFLAPAAKLPHEKKRDHHGGLAQFVNLFESQEETPQKIKVEGKDEKKARIAEEKAKLNGTRIQEYLDAGLYDPTEIDEATSDSFKTLFVARLNYDTGESKLRREFEYYGPIRKIKIVYDSSGKPRGYAFIEYEHERDMRAAYKHADGKKIDGRRVLVDVERARTVEGWLPRRLGGGLGNTRRSLLPKWKRDLGYEEPTERKESDTRRGSAGESKRRRSRSRDRRDRNRRDDGEEPRRRSRSKEQKRKRSRSRDREDRAERKRRSRSREKKRKRSRDRGEHRSNVAVNGNDDGRDREADYNNGHNGDPMHP